MSNIAKTYFLCPTWDNFPPAYSAGRLRLGNIIISPKQPIPALKLAKPPGEEVVPHVQRGITWSKERERARKFSIWTEFLSALLGLGVNATFSQENSDEDIFEFERIETTEAFPDDAELLESMRAATVVKYLSRFFFDKPVYVITGIKTVYGAKVKSIHSKGGAVEVGGKVDGTPAGLPVSVGADVGVEGKDTDAGMFESSDDFVFAFRVRRVLIEKDEDVLQTDYTKGALCEAGGLVEIATSYKVVTLADCDASAKDFELDASTEVKDDNDEECVCVSLMESEDGDKDKNE